MSKKNLKEGIIDKFIDSFIDSYKKGLDKQFINKTKERTPEVAKSLENVSKMLDTVFNQIEKHNKK